MFNVFITYGDTFLPNPNSYDELYYELIRMHQVFDNLYSMGEYLFFTLDKFLPFLPRFWLYFPYMANLQWFQYNVNFMFAKYAINSPVKVIGELL